MDSGLVLVSQGIEATIQPPSEHGSWALTVAPEDYDRALESLRLYRLENRAWPWQQKVFRPGIIFDWGSAAWVALLFLFFWLENRQNLDAVGLMDSSAVARGQWWRLFTATWLHADAAHLTGNATVGMLLLGLVMGRYGTGPGLLTAYLAGVGGNLATYLLATSPHYGLGASGVVMGAIGLLAVQSVSLWKATPHAQRFIVAGIAGGAMLFVLLGVAPDTDTVAHLGGFISGVIVGLPLTLFPTLGKKTTTNLLCGFVFALLVITPWWMAMRAHTLSK
jgi:membrane associated rhomboid family serine protease